MVNFSMGTDPELVFVGPGGVVNGGEYYGGRPGNPAPGEISTDGHQYIIEVRPDPSPEPKTLIKNLKDIFQRHADDTSEEISWQAGSFVEEKPIGGHVHFSKVSVQEHIIDALDGIVGQMSLMLEEESEASQRRAEYGDLADIRTTRYANGVRGFEYRTPASWVLSPTIARGIVALSKATMIEELTQGPFSVRNLKGSLKKAVCSINRVRFKSCDKSHFLNKLPDIWEVIKHQRYWFEGGEEDWVYVCALKHIAKNHPHWHNNKDILHRWGIRDKTPKAYFRSRELPDVPQGQVDAEEFWEAF